MSLKEENKPILLFIASLNFLARILVKDHNFCQMSTLDFLTNDHSCDEAFHHVFANWKLYFSLSNSNENAK